MRGNTIAVYETIKYLQTQTFVENEGFNYKWISRQLVQETLQKEYDLKLELDTIQRHFKKLSISGVVNYLKFGVKDCFRVLKKEFRGMIYTKDEIDSTYTKNQQKIESIFKCYSKNLTLDIKDEFENFILHYENRKKAGKFDGWYSYNFFIKQWTKWCKNINEIINTIDSYFYDEKFKNIGGKKEFEHFQSHYQGLGTLVKEPLKLFESWVRTAKKFKSFTSSTSQKPKEQQEYKWNFRKAKSESDEIKDWLLFDLHYDWKEKHWYKDENQFEININARVLKIGIIKVMHPDFNKEEYLLFNIENKKNQILLEKESQNIEDVEILS